MKQLLQERLQQLKKEFDTGQRMISDLEAKEANLKATLLRISGAIQVLEELLAQEQAGDHKDDVSPSGDVQHLAVG